MSEFLSKRGASLYLGKWNPYAKKYIVICSVCGKKGYSPAVEEEDFCRLNWENELIQKALRKNFSKLELDSLDRCAICAKLMDKKGIL